jgi:hypothetical protein
MSNVITNLRVRFGADTKQFKEGTNEADKSLQNFTKSGTGLMDKFAKMFGVNISGITTSLSEANQGLSGMSRGLNQAAKSSGILTAALKVLKIAFAATGIGLLVGALGSLAAYFTRNQEGADKLARVMASLKAVFAVITDTAASLGRAIVKAFSEPKETIKSLWEFIQRQFVNRIAAIPKLIEAAWNITKGIFTGGTREAAAEFGDAMLQMTTGMDKAERSKAADSVRDLGRQMRDAARAAGDLTRQLQQLRDEENRLIEVQAARRAEIAELRLTAREDDRDIRERAEAQKRAMDMTKAIYQDEIRLAKERARILEEQMELSDNMAENDRELAEARAELNRLTASMNGELRTMQTYYNGLNKQLEQTIALEQQLAADRKKQSDVGFATVSPIGPGALATEETGLAPMRALEDRANQIKSMNEGIGQSYIDMSDVINGAMQDAAIGLGAGLGDMMATGEGFKGFGQMVGGVFADMAITVGKIAIGTGSAVEAVKKSLTALGGFGAIAAGVALIAIGTAAKSAMASAASGGGGGTFSRPMSFDSTGSQQIGSGVSRVEPIRVEVTGEFRQRGPDLVAVVGKENDRRRRST